MSPLSKLFPIPEYGPKKSQDSQSTHTPATRTSRIYNDHLSNPTTEARNKASADFKKLLQSGELSIPCHYGSSNADSVEQDSPRIIPMHPTPLTPSHTRHRRGTSFDFGNRRLVPGDLEPPPTLSSRERCSSDPLTSIRETVPEQWQTQHNYIPGLATAPPQSRRSSQSSTAPLSDQRALKSPPTKIVPIITQQGRYTLLPSGIYTATEDIPLPLGPRPDPYSIPWGQMKDPIAKLIRDDEIEAWELEKKKREEEAAEAASNPEKPLSPPPPPRKLMLNEAQPPDTVSETAKALFSTTMPPSPERDRSFLRTLSGTFPFSPSKIRRRRTSEPSPVICAGRIVRKSEIDGFPIFLTLPKDRLQDPRYASADWFKCYKTHPRFSFTSDGYVIRSRLTMKMIELFSSGDLLSASLWVDTIPDIPALRQGVPGVDLEYDWWIRYWETLVVMADIRRGCELAGRAVEVLQREHEEDVAQMMARMRLKAQGREVEFGG